jgi:hypothetical protein
MKTQRLKYAIAALVWLAVSAVSMAQNWMGQKKDDWAIDNAMIGPDSPIELAAGSTYQAQVVYPVPDGPLYPLKAKVSWRIEPEVKGISIDRDSGKITVQADVAHGTRATVGANVNNGQRKLSAKLYVFRPEMNPFVGRWGLESQQACSDMEESGLGPSQKSVEWKFHVDEQFWIGRELGISAGVFLSGRYQLDSKTRKLTFMPEWPKGKKNSSWSWTFEENGTKLLLRPDASQTGCGFVLLRQQR